VLNAATGNHPRDIANRTMGAGTKESSPRYRYRYKIELFIRFWLSNSSYLGSVQAPLFDAHLIHFESDQLSMADFSGTISHMVVCVLPLAWRSSLVSIRRNTCQQHCSWCAPSKNGRGKSYTRVCASSIARGGIIGWARDSGETSAPQAFGRPYFG
jgi:hypothetical protein